MANEIVKKRNEALQSVATMEFLPTLVEDDYSVATFTKLPLSRIPALGTAFEPIASAIQKVTSGSGATSGLYRVTVPSGTHLAEFKNGVGNLGTALDANNQIAGQAVLNPLVCNPTMIFMAATLANIDKKLDAIQELQKEMMDFLVQKERAELRGNLVFLSDILNNYKFNWNNDMYKNSNHIKVLDIRQTAEQKILFYREQISSKLKKKSFIHSDRDAQKQINKVQAYFKEYQLALYMHGFASFLDVMLVGNYASEYLLGIRRKIEDYSWQYRELYTKCYDQLETYFDSSIQSSLLKGLKTVSKATGEAIAKVPVISKGPVDEALIEAGSKLDKLGTRRSVQQLKKLVDRQSSCVRPFVDNIETVDRLYNNAISMVFDKDTLYLGIEEEA